MKQCRVCRKDKYFLNPGEICDTCNERLSQARAEEATRSVILSTSIDVPGRSIESVAGIVATEAALGLSIFKDIANNWRDFIGGRASTAQAALKEARQSCLDQLKREAATIGADAVIAIDLDYNELSTAGSGGILFVAATGTAVKLRPIPPSPST